MKTKIIISLCLLIATHNSFCMLMNLNQTKHVQNKCKEHQINQKSADRYLKPFMLRSLLKNSEMFDKQSLAVQRTIIRQCKENNDTSPIIGLIQLPAEDQIKIISYFFEDECKKAAEYFISIPLEVALTKYNDLPENTLTLLQPKAKLAQSIIFRLTKKEEIILAAIYTDQTMATNKLKILTKSPHDILQVILQQNLNVRIPEHENKLKVLYRIVTSPVSNDIFTYFKNINLCAVIPLTILGIPLLSYGGALDNIKDVCSYLQLQISLQLLAQPCVFTLLSQPEWKDNYNFEISKTITKPLKSLL